MKTERETKIYEDDEITELDIEGLTEILGGIEDEEQRSKENCGLGCFVGSGTSIPDDKTK
jgi:hypothetical protein